MCKFLSQFSLYYDYWYAQDDTVSNLIIYNASQVQLVSEYSYTNSVGCRIDANCNCRS